MTRARRHAAKTPATVSALALLGALAAPAAPAAADAIADFYRGKQVTIVVSAGAGGGYSQQAQMLSRHLGRHIPGNPNIVVQHKPAAAGLAAANYMYNVAPKDGTWIGSLRNATAFSQAVELQGVKYDAAKFHWIGSIAPIINVLAVLKSAPATDIAGLKEREVILGAGGKMSTLYTFPTVMNRMLDTRFKVVTGYRGTKDVRLALDREEVSGMVQPYTNWVKTHWHKEGLISYVVQFGYERIKELPDVPTLVELGTTDDERQILKLVCIPAVTGRNYALPPGTPAARVAALRKAFDETMADPAYAKEVRGRGRLLDPKTGAELQKLIGDVLATPAPLVAKAKEHLGF